MGFNLWWARNDGMSGHVWLSADDMRMLVDEMRSQGMAWEEGRDHVTSDEVAAALHEASREPSTGIGFKLWEDWLAFLAGARENGGIVIRA